MGGRPRARLGVDAAPARRRVPPHPRARRARCRAARPERVPGGRGEGLRAHAAARVRRRALAARPDAGHGRRRVQPQGGARARGRDQPAAPGPRLGALRRHAARSRREEIDRFLSGRSDVTVATDVLGHGVNLPCETLLFAETTKFDGESRRDLLPWELAQIAGPRRALRPRRARPRRRADRGRRGRAPIPSSSRRRCSRTWCCRRGHSATASSTRRASGRGSPTSASTIPVELDAALAAWHRVATRAWAHEGWLAVESLQPDPRPARRGPAPARRAQPAPLARGHLEARQRSGRRGQRRAARDARARARRRSRRSARCSRSCSTRLGFATRRSRKRSRLDEPQASCAGSRSSIRASAASRSSGRPSSRRPPRRASSRACASR